MALSTPLLLFVDVVQQGSFTKAAALHDMDNSSLSKQIKKLEANLGVQLLNRSTRSFSLTPAGEEILAQAKTLKQTLDQIQGIADAYQSQPKGNLRIASPVYFGQQYLQPVIAQFLQRYPDVQLSLALDDKKADIIADHIDLAFRIGKMPDSNLIAKKIASTHLALVASQDFIQQHGRPTTLAELLALPAVIYSNGDLIWDQLQISAEPNGALITAKMRGNYRTSDIRALLDAVSAGMGYALIDLSHLQRPIDQLQLEPLLTDHRLSCGDTGIYAVYPHRKQTKLVAEFIHAVEQYLGAPAFWQQHLPNYDSLYN
ncbi:LysR family transcriptional regulator [uncultured Ferrimonas sp.]|uniref:LysR family transcriptional regulator n=1 Tax=uncultured Ferrimonas sp. TaxID=432640 RepID=UPI00260E7B2B|nr:LysR family transcriptional regulator [uncultured Ferrimonas sp.]